VTASVSSPVIELRAITKRYGRTVALDGIDLDVGPGELVGLLGPNGAGKTTTVKLLLGLARPSAGEGRVLGAPLGDLAVRRRIGYLPELFRYQPWLTAREVLRLHGRLAGLEPARREEAAREALARVDLTGRGDDRVGGFSKGMQQRLGLGAALLGDPDLVLLDEPTSALDPVGRIDVREIVRAARDRGATVILNSHLLTEVERVCDRVVIVHRGRVVAAGPLEEVVAADGVRIRATGLDLLVRRAPVAGVTPSEDDGEWLTYRPIAADLVPELVAGLVAAGARIHAVEPGRGSLEARFLELVRDAGDASDAPDAGPPDDRDLAR
jgi:ABC-2 type transport system ATP-binding protein